MLCFVHHEIGFQRTNQISRPFKQHFHMYFVCRTSFNFLHSILIVIPYFTEERWDGFSEVWVYCTRMQSPYNNRTLVKNESFAAAYSFFNQSHHSNFCHCIILLHWIHRRKKSSVICLIRGWVCADVSLCVFYCLSKWISICEE